MINKLFSNKGPELTMKELYIPIPPACTPFKGMSKFQWYLCIYFCYLDSKYLVKRLKCEHVFVGHEGCVSDLCLRRHLHMKQLVFFRYLIF